MKPFNSDVYRDLENISDEFVHGAWLITAVTPFRDAWMGRSHLTVRRRVPTVHVLVDWFRHGADVPRLRTPISIPYRNLLSRSV